MKIQKVVAGVFALMFLASLACSRAGQVLEPAEATATAEAGKPGVEILDSANIESGPKVGDIVTLTATGFLVNLRDEPGGGIAGNAPKGAEATVLEVAQTEDDRLWYKIDSDAGEGWIGLESIDENLSAEAEGGEGIQAGDNVEVTGIGFLVNLFDEPGSTNIIGGLPKNASVVVLEIALVDDMLWYHIDSDAGEGWIPEESVVTEEP